MKATIENDLVYKYPSLFQADKSEPEITVPYGWKELILHLCSDLNSCLCQYPNLKTFKILAISQEYGELVIIAREGNTVTNRLIRETIIKSKTICEFDGRPSSGLFVCAPNWFHNLCTTCADRHAYVNIKDFNNIYAPCETIAV